MVAESPRSMVSSDVCAIFSRWAVPQKIMSQPHRMNDPVSVAVFLMGESEKPLIQPAHGPGRYLRELLLERNLLRQARPVKCVLVFLVSVHKRLRRPSSNFMAS